MFGKKSVRALEEVPPWIATEKRDGWCAQERRLRRQGLAEQFAIAFVKSGRKASADEITKFSRDLAERLIPEPKPAD